MIFLHEKIIKFHDVFLNFPFISKSNELKEKLTYNENILQNLEELADTQSQTTLLKKYQLFSLKTLAIGGTFDFLHSGHKV